jgi:hypothetical protein
VPVESSGAHLARPRQPLVAADPGKDRMRNRTLSLKKDTLVELTTEELGSIAGASGLTCVNCNSDFQQCLTGVRCLSVVGC